MKTVYGAIHWRHADHTHTYTPCPSTFLPPTSNRPPSFQEKAAKHVVPTLADLASESRKAYVKTNEFFSSRMNPYFGSSYTPLLASLLSHFLLLLPLSLILLLLFRARVALTLHKLQLLANLYLCLYCAGLLASCVVIGAEPMATLQRASERSYLSLQLLQAGGFVLFLSLQVRQWGP